MALKQCPYCCEDIQEAAVKCKHCGSLLTAEAPPLTVSFGSGPVKRLTRSRTDSFFAGVFGGMAHQIGVDPTLLRIAYALLTVFTGILPGIGVYIILCFIIPLEGEAVS